MESQAKSRYLSFCEKQHVPVFYEPWYLDITTDGEWEVALVEEQGAIVGAWPYQVESKAGFMLVRMPVFTPHLGPLVYPPQHLNTSYKETSFCFNVIKELESKLNSFGYLRINMSSEIKSWFPFYGLGYSQTTRYTYLIDHSLGVDEVARNMKKQLRNVVTKDKHSTHISKSEDVATFLTQLEDGFQANKIQKFFNRDEIEQILVGSMERGCGTIWIYHNKDSKAIGHIFVIEDAKKAYLLFTCASEEGKKVEAVGSLIWHAIKGAVLKKKDFDFEGSMIPGVEKFFRSFGGEQKAYHQVTKVRNPLLKLYHILRG